MRTVHLHIGTEKTGTTTIQEFCARHRDALEAAGAVYPRLGFEPQAHFSLVAPLHPDDNDGRPLEFAPPGTSDFEREWAPLRRLLETDDQRDVILSAEHFSSRIKRRGIRRIADFFSRFADVKVRIVVFLRRQDDFLVSTYTTMIRTGSTVGFDEVCRRFDEHRSRLDYRSLLQRWIEGFGREDLVVRVFEPEQMPGGLLRCFLDAVGVHLPSELVDSVGSLNRSWSIEVLELARRLHDRHADLPLRERIAFLDELDASIDGTPPSALLGRREREQLLRTFSESNAWVAREVLGRGDRPLFLAPPRTDVPERGLRIGCEQILGELLRHQVTARSSSARPRPSVPPD